MKTYQLSHTDLQVSRIGYGCLAIGRKWGDIDTDEARRNTTHVIETSLSGGINFFDHADIYADGRSEELIGDVLRQDPSLRERMVIQSKCGVRFEGSPDKISPSRYDFSHEHIVASAEASLRRLGIEQLDILLLHRPDPLMEPDEVARAFDDLRCMGKVRYFGVSNFSASQMALLQRGLDQPLVVNQLEISLLHHHLINEGVAVNQTGYAHVGTGGTLDYCRLHGIRVQPWTPLARGRMIEPFADASETVQAVARQIASYADAYGTSKEAVALGWLLRHPAGLQPIVGTTNLQRIADCCKADAIELSREEWYTLFNAARGKPVP
ncbi:MAG: aldo/keto reductase [Candidatus Hydrogenedentes bacterium]|nr:aldo/keto reductase [Candidatus Hydrogenedentota bacterium]